jgi:hypothetical protein
MKKKTCAMMTEVANLSIASGMKDMNAGNYHNTCRRCPVYSSEGEFSADDSMLIEHQ